MADEGLVSCATSFPDGAQLVYCLESSPACVDPVANFSGNQLSIRLPQDWVRSWSESEEEVSIESSQSLDHGQELKILVEKDFACLAPREGEDESDMFPHPQEGETSC